MSTRRRLRDERGVSSVELVLYMPILLTLILLTVQFSLYYLGRQTASAVARETARVARVTADADTAEAAGKRYVRNIGKGVLNDDDIEVVFVDDNRVRVTVTGRPQKILPLGSLDITQKVEGPVEIFVEGP